MTLRDHLDALFDADRRLRRHEADLFREGDDDALAALLSDAVDEAGALDDRRESTMRLERLADLCAQVPGAKMVEALIRILDADEPPVRVAAGEALLDVGYERYAEVARAIERRLDEGTHGLAMSELPWILAEIGEPSAPTLLRRFLVHPDADVIASTIEALVRLGDPSVAQSLQALVDDERVVSLGEIEHEQETTTASIGELAREALEELTPARS